MSGITGPLNKIIEATHQEVQAFSQSVAQGKSPVSQAKTDKFIQNIQEKVDYLQNAAKGDFQAKASNLNQQSLARLANAVMSLGGNSALARQLAKPEQQANLGNVLLSLGETIEKMRRKHKEKEVGKKGYKVERFEIIEFLNSTEKQFHDFVATIKERDADEDVLFEFMQALIKQMKMLKILKKMSSSRLKKLKISPKEYKRLLRIIRHMTQNEGFRHNIYEIGMKGKAGNMHLRFWKVVKELRDLLEGLST